MRLVVLFATLGAFVASCADPPPPEPFQISVKVESDPSRPIAGATISRGNRPLGTTGLDGRATLKISGVEGEITDVVITCPEGFQAPSTSSRR